MGANGFALVPHVPLSWAAIVVVEPAVGNPTDTRFGKRGNAPMWISFPYRSSSASRFTAGAFGFLTFNDVAEINLAVASSVPNAGPKAKENGAPDHERDHNCVPQRHGATG